MISRQKFTRFNHPHKNDKSHRQYFPSPNWPNCQSSTLLKNYDKQKITESNVATIISLGEYSSKLLICKNIGKYKAAYTKITNNIDRINNDIFSKNLNKI